MSLSDAVRNGPPHVSRPSHLTVTDVWLASLNEEDRESALQAIADQKWRHRDLNALFKQHGLEVSDQQFSRFRYNHGLPRS